MWSLQSNQQPGKSGFSTITEQALPKCHDNQLNYNICLELARDCKNSL